MRTQLRAGLLLLCSMTTASTIWAMDSSDMQAVRNLSNQAAIDYKQGHYEAAHGKFSQAYAIAKVPKLAVWVARVNEQLGHLVLAYELYREAIALVPNELWKGNTQQVSQQEAEEALRKLEPRLPRLTVSVGGTSASEVTVSIDDKSVPSALLGVERFTDPGEHRIVAKYGDEVKTETVVLVEGEAKRLVLKFQGSTSQAVNANHNESSPAHDRSKSTTRTGDSDSDPSRDRGGRAGKAQRTWGYVGLSVGAAALAFGGVAGLLVASKYGDLNRKCPDRSNCQYADEVQSYQTLQTLSTTGFIVGGVAAATGVALFLTAPKDKPVANVSLWLSGSSLEMKGQF